ncbi:Intradiol ring-cleavage dioxygenase [Mariannaea sp. PMI_226]|nr:Intradiol ring-cleavage dioxygenase [Mariannaea sp. PMI_226]
MRYRDSLLDLLAFTSLWSSTNAHGGKSLGEELRARQVYARDNHMNLRHCADKFERDGLYARAFERRAVQLDTLRKRSQFADDSKNHQARDGFFDFVSDDFGFSSTKHDGCVLHPELTEGPYYIEGEKVRDNLVDGQDGVLFLLDLQIVDSHTCEPVDGVYVEIWHTNATGVYSGVVADDNGSGKADKHNAYTTFNRGIQKTSEDGVVFFTSIFPGHYTGRAPHVHVMTHIKPEIRKDGTIISNTATHIGQLFLDQRLILDIEALSPYRKNKNKLTYNVEDYYFRQAFETSNPIMPWMKLGWPGHEHAILGWMPVGINMSNVRHAYVAGTLKPEPTD